MTLKIRFDFRKNKTKDPFHVPVLNIVFQKYLMKINVSFGSILMKGSDFCVFRYMNTLSSEAITGLHRTFKLPYSTKYLMISGKTIG